MLKAKSRILPIEDIKIPEAFAQTTPRMEKVEKAKAFYGVTRQFDKPVLIDRNGYIFDGYARFVAAKELGLDKVPVVQVVPFKKKADKPTNKYESMSNAQLDLEMCVKKGACSATHSSHRKNDCPLYGTGSCDITDANRAEVIEYLLAEDAEAEPKPEYWNGKVVCVESCDGDFTVGKIYEFVNGKVTDNDGIARLMGDKKLFKSVEEWNEACACLIARFIEFKGEAHD
jgi:hypothetical protein